MSFKIDHNGMAHLLKYDMRGPVNALAQKIADNARAQGIRVGDRDGGPAEYDVPVTVSSYTTDRAAAAVTIAHPAGLAVQAKHGLLTKAAAGAGVKVVSR